jgi:hypothetical protein
VSKLVVTEELVPELPPTDHVHCVVPITGVCGPLIWLQLLSSSVTEIVPPELSPIALNVTLLPMQTVDGDALACANKYPA